MKYLNFLTKWILIFIIGSFIAFGTTRLMSGNPVEMMLSLNELAPTPENISYVEKEFGLDRPLSEQYLTWIKDFLKGNWGNSFMTGVDLKPEIMRRAPISFALGLGGLLYASILAFFLGYLASLKDGFFNKLTKGLTLLTQTLPIFMLILLFVYFFGVKYQFIRFFSQQSTGVILIGIFFVGLPLIGPMSRTVRIYFLDVMEQSFFHFYIERGYDKSKALLKYCYHEPLQGLFGLVISQAAYVIGASSVVEFALSIQGISTLLIDSISHRDYLITQTYIMIIILWMFFIHLLFTVFQNQFIKRGGSHE